MRTVRADFILAAALGLAACGAHALELGTLFSSPEERTRLDRLRRGDPVESTQAPSEASPASRRALTGYVKRSDGRSTAFVDGAPVPVAPRSAPLLEPGSVRAYARDSEDLRVERKRAP